MDAFFREVALKLGNGDLAKVEDACGQGGLGPGLEGLEEVLHPPGPAAGVAPGGRVLLLGNLFWVLAYDTEYAMVDRDDDLRLGMKTSAITLGTRDVSAVMASYAFYLSIWALALVQYGVNAIFCIAIIPALAQVLWHYRLIRARSRDGCFRAFRLNHWLGFAVFAGVALSYGPIFRG